MIQGARVYVLNELLYNYYIGRNDSIINTIKEKDLDILFTVNELFVIYENINIQLLKMFFIGLFMIGFLMQ